MVMSAVARGRGTAVSVVSAFVSAIAWVTVSAVVRMTGVITTTGGRVLYSNLVREESREGAADCVLLERRLGIAR